MVPAWVFGPLDVLQASFLRHTVARILPDPERQLRKSGSSLPWPVVWLVFWSPSRLSSLIHCLACFLTYNWYAVGCVHDVESDMTSGALVLAWNHCSSQGIHLVTSKGCEHWAGFFNSLFMLGYCLIQNLYW